MKGINFGRVILGGLLAGVINNIAGYAINDVILKADHDAAFKALGKTMPEGASTLVTWIVMGFVFGIAAVWLYAAIRPRYGAGVGTAVRAGVAIWFFSSVYMATVMTNLGVFALNATSVCLELAAGVIATVAGAWLYKEDGAAA
jgi:hypothetical protein